MAFLMADGRIVASPAEAVAIAKRALLAYEAAKDAAWARGDAVEFVRCSRLWSAACEEYARYARAWAAQPLPAADPQVVL